MTINIDKTKIPKCRELKSFHFIDGHQLQNGDEFLYLGSVIYKSGGCFKENNRIAKARMAFNYCQKPIFTNRCFQEQPN